MGRLITICGLLLWFNLLQAQQEKTALVPADTTWRLIDSLTLYTPSLRVYTRSGMPLPDSLWEADNRSFRIVPSAFRQNLSDSLRIVYRTLCCDLEAPVTFFDHGETQPIEGGILHSIGSVGEERPGYELPSENSGLRYSGDFSRGISMGNNQNLSLNSGFHLQMNGLLGNGIRLRAAITDENLPIQPEGNTQQLREFDRIYIQIEKDKQQLTLGDYRLQHLPKGYFMRFDKKLEGANYRQAFKMKNGASGELQASAAINRGKFARYRFNGQEGNQGPYRLRGAEGETFVIVLSGTERIYLDGQLLTRGAEADYVIDYNRGEITFTHRHLITAQSRIIAEYEYSDNRYLRSIYGLQTKWNTGKMNWQFQWLSQQDSRSRNSDQLLTDEQYLLLVNAGDDPAKAVVSGIDSSGTSTDPVRYQLVDTLFNGHLYSVLLWTPDGSGAYSARFSDLGPGNGNYIRLDNTANGIVYAWIAPDSTGMPQGRYEPVLRLTPPEQHQLYTLGAARKIGADGYIRLEAALSQKDDNRFSALDKNNDLGLGVHLQYLQNISLGKKWKSVVSFAGEHIRENFRPLSPYRPVEFVRDWNTAELPLSDETLGNLSISLERDSFRFRWQAEHLRRADGYGGFRQTPSVYWHGSRWQLNASGSFLESSNNSLQTKFYRTTATLRRLFPKLKNSNVSFSLLTENNRHLPKGADTLLPVSNGFEEYRIRWAGPQSERFGVDIGYLFRLDYLPGHPMEASPDNKLHAATRAQAWQTSGFWQIRKQNRYRSQLHWNLQYRRLIPVLYDASGLAETYLGRVQWQWSLAKGSLQGGSSYQVSSGREQKMLFVYKAVNPGEGIYQHVDFNQDGIEQNNEFILAANPDEATHLRIAVFTGEFIRTNNLLFSQNLNIQPRALWRNKKGWRGLLSKFSVNSSLQVDRKVPLDGSSSAWNPFLWELPDSSIIALNLRRQHLINFQSGAHWAAHWQYTDVQNRIILTTGFERRALQEHQWQLRWNPSQKWSAKLPLKAGLRAYITENFEDRNYRIAFRQMEPALSWMPDKRWRLQGSWRFELQENRVGGESARQRALTATVHFQLSNRSALLCDLSQINIAFEGNPATPAGFAMLNGLQPGGNWRWSINLDQQLPNNLRLSLLYNGRKSENYPVVHTGQARLTALF